MASGGEEREELPPVVGLGGIGAVGPAMTIVSSMYSMVTESEGPLSDMVVEGTGSRWFSAGHRCNVVATREAKGNEGGSLCYRENGKKFTLRESSRTRDLPEMVSKEGPAAMHR